MEVRREFTVCVFGDTVLNIYIKIRQKEMSLMYTPSSTKYISRFRGQTLNSTLSRGRGFCKLAEHFGRLCSPSCLRLLFCWGYVSYLWKLHCLFRDLTKSCEEGKPIAYAWLVFRLESSNTVCVCFLARDWGLASWAKQPTHFHLWIYGCHGKFVFVKSTLVH